MIKKRRHSLKASTAIKNTSTRQPLSDVSNILQIVRLNAFDKIPSRSPPYAYQRDTVRKQAERKKLPG